MISSDGPLARYQHDIEQRGFSPDPGQRAAVRELQRLFEALSTDGGGLKARIGRLLRGQRKDRPRGIYMWGGVGRGKTYLMDTFFDTLPTERKYRVHFHRFMRDVHRALKARGGQKNPLTEIAADMAGRFDVICFDEFFVSDITDAMLLGGLFEALLDRHRLVLVATSNIAPDNLYENGLQRQRFLPAIALLKQHTVVLNVDGGIDYRLRTLEQAELFHFPLDADADKRLLETFNRLAPEQGVSDKILEVEGRSIPSRLWADDVVWFDFYALCDGPRSQNDYIELAREYHAVLISGIPQMGSSDEDMARRFISLVDEFYDRHVKVVMTAAVALEQLYQGQALQFEFQRTLSRLAEMQSHDYLALEHRP